MAIFNKMGEVGRQERNPGSGRRRVARALRLGLVCAAVASALPAHAEFYLHGWDGWHQEKGIVSLQPTVLFYLSQTDFDTSGSLIAPSGLTDYNRLQVDLGVAWGMTSRLTVFGRGDWMRVGLDDTTVGGYGLGFGDQTLGASYRVWQGIGAVDVQAQIEIPAYNNSAANAAGTPYLGDGSIDLTGGAILTFPVVVNQQYRFEFKGGAGYTYRLASLPFSMAVPWSVAAAFEPQDHGVFARAGALGVLSLRTDPTTPSLSYSLGTGGDFITNAVNPTILTLRGQVGYRFNPDFALTLTGMDSVFGTDAPNGFVVSLGLELALGRAGNGPGGSRSATRAASRTDAAPAVEYGSEEQFVRYGLEGKVLRSNDRLNLVRIDKGSQDGVEVGQVFDIFSVKVDGTASEPVARAQVTDVHSNEAVLSVQQYYREVLIDEGFLAKRPIP